MIRKQLMVVLGTVALMASAFVFTTAPVFAQDINCGLDKVGTFAEPEGNPISHRIEVGGDGTQHVDWYPDRGIRTISYVVSPQEPDIWWGFGSIWEGQCAQDNGFDYIADAAGYAHGSDWQPGRMNNGHSGLVMDTATCSLYDTIWNELSDDDSQSDRLVYTDDLLALHRASQDTILCGDLSSADIQAYDVNSFSSFDAEADDANLAPAMTAEEDELQARIDQLLMELAEAQAGADPAVDNYDNDLAVDQISDPVEGDVSMNPCTIGKTVTFPSNFQNKKPWHIKTGDRWGAINFWSNWTNPNFDDVSFLVRPGFNEKLLGGGTITYIKGDCSKTDAEFIRAGSSYRAIKFGNLPKRYVAN